ncbi:MAG: TonB-dependent receptor [Bryobacterales bacterium]|nr:TonB-dependent receptor [Bryobacterales bacterium]
MLQMLSVLLLGAAAWAQSITGTLTGYVKDPAGLPVAGAGIRLLQSATGAQRDGQANEQGRFVFSGLQPGVYELRATAPGFKTLTRSGIALAASETLPAGDLVLEIGAASESVTVTAAGAAVQTASSERSGAVTSSQVEGIQTRSRNVISLMNLLPGVLDTADSTREKMDRAVGSFIVQGNRLGSNEITYDGLSAVDLGNNAALLVTISQEAVSEVKVLLSGYQAEYGRNSGAHVQIVTKSGTRDFHGGASHYNRNEAFNATNFFLNRLGQSRPLYRYQTWTYNIGGPVTIPGKFNSNRDKLFFFWTQEHWPLKLPLPVGQVTVPTELERGGDFSRTLDQNSRLIPITDPLSRQPFPGNVIPASRIDSNGQALLRVFPAPNFLDWSISAGRYNHVFQAQRETPLWTQTLKLDYHATSKHLFSGTYNFAKDTTKGWWMGSNWPQMPHSFEVPGRMLSSRYQWIISPVAINELTVGVGGGEENVEALTQEDIRRNTKDAVGYRLNQLYPANNPENLIPNATYGGVLGAAMLEVWGRYPHHSTRTNLLISDNFTRTRGTHTIKAGFYFDRFVTANRNLTQFNGAFNFGRDVNNPLDTNYAYSNGLLGIYASYTETSSRPLREIGATNIEWFLQDNWKVTPKLTLDYGLRFAWITPVSQQEGLVSGFDPARVDRTKRVRLIPPRLVGGRRVGVHPVTGEVYPAVAVGALAPDTGDPSNGMVVPGREKGYPYSLVDTRPVHLGPRFGFAYDPFGRGKTAVRGGFGMFYNRVSTLNTLYNLVSQRPLALNPVLFYGTMSNLSTSTGLEFPDNVVGLDRIGKVPAVMNYSLNVQQNIGRGTVLEAGYYASLGRHLMWSRDLNAIPFGANFDPKNADPTNPRVPLPAAFLRPIPGLNGITYREWAASSNYHSLQATATRRFTRGLEFGAAWTWSKTMDYNTNDADAVSPLVPVRIWNYGLSGLDRTHIFRLNYIYDVPGVRAGSRPVRVLLHGWQVSGVTSFISGAPSGVGMTTVVPTDFTGTPSQGARVDITGNPVLPKGERTFSRNFRTEVFRMPAVGTIGTAARTVMRGPGTNNWDIAVFKNIPLREALRMQFRCETYNTFNHTQFSALDAAARFDAQGRQINARFGEFTAARPPRIMQFALRLLF